MFFFKKKKVYDRNKLFKLAQKMVLRCKILDFEKAPLCQLINFKRDDRVLFYVNGYVHKGTVEQYFVYTFLKEVCYDIIDDTGVVCYVKDREIIKKLPEFEIE